MSVLQRMEPSELSKDVGLGTRVPVHAVGANRHLWRSMSYTHPRFSLLATSSGLRGWLPVNWLQIALYAPWSGPSTSSPGSLAGLSQGALVSLVLSGVIGGPAPV